VHYLQDGPFQGHDKKADPQMVGVTLASLVGKYIPIPNMTLKTAEIRKLNKAIDILEAEPDDGWFAFEDEDFKVLQRVAVGLIEATNMARSAPMIEDLLNEATTEKPESNVVDIKKAAGE
jgi:hypothetical protein